MKDILVEEKTTSKRKSRSRKTNGSNVKKKIVTSVIVVIKDLADEIKTIYDSLAPAMDKKRTGFELIFVDDGSRDASWTELRAIAEPDPRVKLIRFRSSFGESAAFDAGLKKATGERIIFFTGRVRINPAQVPELLDKLEDGSDLVMGWRHPRRDSGLNQFISRMFNNIIKWVTKITLHDMNSGVFAAKTSVLQEVPVYGNLNVFLPILAAGKGYKVGDHKIEQLAGKFRQSRYPSEYIQRLLDIVSVVFLTRYSKKPLHFLGFIGIIFTLVGAGMNLYLFIYRVLQFGPIAGRPLLLVGALLLVIGIQMISIGLIGEMIIFTHARQIKEYTIEEILE